MVTGTRGVKTAEAAVYAVAAIDSNDNFSYLVFLFLFLFYIKKNYYYDVLYMEMVWLGLSVVDILVLYFRHRFRCLTRGLTQDSYWLIPYLQSTF